MSSQPLIHWYRFHKESTHTQYGAAVAAANHMVYWCCTAVEQCISTCICTFVIHYVREQETQLSVLFARCVSVRHRLEQSC